jgi:3-oxoacyl-[acyl-carrier protein] reductase
MDPRVTGISTEQRVVLVTGSGSGLGAGISRALAAEGFAVVVTARQHDAAAGVVEEITAEGGTAHPLACDVTDVVGVRQVIAGAVERFGRLDGLVHNATSRQTHENEQVAALSPTSWDDHVGVALYGAFHLAQASFEHLRASRGSFVIFTSSSAVIGSKSNPAYGAVKAAQRGFVKALAREWGPEGIRVNALMPSARSPAWDARHPEGPGDYVTRVPLGRIGDARSDIGPVVGFLLGDASRFVTGQTLPVNGGTYTGF